MFKIESYVTSIILANADRYIKNFRKQDAQVSLWEGDATFHNIDLNVDALNEEFQSPFLFISGYIHDLNIHVPWTKLMSEPVTISVNTIECVMRLKSRDEKTAGMSEKCENSCADVKIGKNTEKRSIEVSPQASYTSTLTSKILNNLSIYCENVILKVVEEDIVLSMNIEKFSFENVDENWIQTMTDVSADKLLTRKLIVLSGLTICLDKQNSSGRIDTYLEPLLYRCLIYIRVVTAHSRVSSRKTVYTHFDILSDKMLFTISEPQIPMLVKLAMIILGSEYGHGTNSKETSSSNGENSTISVITNPDSSTEEFFGSAENGGELSWSDWLWSMVPEILPQDDDDLSDEKEISPTFHLGFCVNDLDIKIKIWNNTSKKKSKQEFNNLLESKFCGCYYRMTLKSTEWLNIQFGISYISIRIPAEGNDNRIKQVFFSGIQSCNNFSKETLFDEKFNFSSFKMYQDESDLLRDTEDSVQEVTNFDFTRNSEFSIGTHLNHFTENTLLEKAPAFGFDYVKCYDARMTFTNTGDVDGNHSFEDHSLDVSGCQAESVSRKLPERIVLLRLIFGSSVVKVTSKFLNRIIYLHKIVTFGDMSSYRQTISGSGGNQRDGTLSNYTTRFTFFDFSVEFHAPSSNMYSVAAALGQEQTFSDIPESFSSCHSTPLNLFCKCIDGEITTVQNVKITSIKMAKVVCSLLQLNREYNLLKCEKLDLKSSKNFNTSTLDLHLDLASIIFESSKPNLLLAYYVTNYLLHTIWHPQERNDYYGKIFFSSLIDDTFLPGNTLLQVSLETVKCAYQCVGDTFAVCIRLGNCEAYANNNSNDVPKKIKIFTTNDSTNKSPSVVKCMLQYCKNCNQDCTYPSYIQLILKNIEINLDLIFYSWIMYEPVANILHRTALKINKNVRESVPSKPASSRKVSDSSSTSHGRKYGTAYPKPKESVHSSGEPEVHSPPEVTETEPSDIYQLADLTSVPKQKQSIIQYLADRIHTWCTYVVHADISDITVYIPTFHTQPSYQDVYPTMKQAVDEAFKQSCIHDHAAGVFIFFLKSLTIKCDFPTWILDESYNIDTVAGGSLLVSAPAEAWSHGKLTSPWVLSISDVRLSTLLQDKLSPLLLNPFSASCTIGVSCRNEVENGISASAVLITTVCVHLDFQPISIELTKKQTLLIATVIEALIGWKKNSENKILAVNTTTEMSAKSASISSIETRNVRKLAGWIQWTFTKCSLNVYHQHAELESESALLSVEAEDSIVSLEFDDVFHKLKIKLASLGVYHRKRNSESHTWKNGAFCGAIIQRCYSQPSSSIKTQEDDSDDRFLLLTITRARSSNLKTRISTSMSNLEIPILTNTDHYVTEITVDICPVDVILPLFVINKFLLVLKPLLNTCGTSSKTDETLIRTQADNDGPLSLPLVYLNVPVFRIFIPTSESSKISSPTDYDTLICEIQRVSVDCHPKNLILRKQTHSKFLYCLSGKRYTTVDQALQKQQYQLFVSSVSVKTGMWNEIEQMIFKEQLLAKEPPSVFEQNPAVMWNQGYQPVNNQTDLKCLSPLISNFSCHIQLAPAIECYSFRTTIQGPHLEVNVLSDLEITVSLSQVSLVLTLYRDYLAVIVPLFDDFERKNSTFLSFVENNIAGKDARTTDSGIESLEQSSVSSSIISKSKNVAPIAEAHHAIEKTENVTCVSKISNVYQSATLAYNKKPLTEMYITAPKLYVTLYKTEKTESRRRHEQKLCSALLLCEFVQPSLMVCSENGYPSWQFDIFNMCVRIPDVDLLNGQQYSSNIPCRDEFPIKILDTRKCNCEPYSKIINSSFTLKLVQHINKQLKIVCVLGQPFLIECDVAVVRYVSSLIRQCYSECQKYIQLLNIRFRPKGAKNKEEKQEIFSRSLFDSFNIFTSFNVTTSRFILAFRCKSRPPVVLLNVDSMAIDIKSTQGMKSQNESICFACSFKSVAFSLPEVDCRDIAHIMSKDESVSADVKKEDLLSNLILKPWNVNVELTLIWNRWNLFQTTPWKSLKVESDSISFHISPPYVDKVSLVISNYISLYREYFPEAEKFGDFSNEIESEHTASAIGANTEFYKDDLRAGAFQYVKIEDDKCGLPSPYEVFFCNRRIQPFMCWRYPQPRNLTKLQIYPILVEEINDDFLQSGIRCQLQYFNESTGCYDLYVSFNLCDNAIQNINLPSEKPRIIAAECWRIVLLDFVDCYQNYDVKMDIKSIVGYVRIDSVFHPSLVPTTRLLINVTELQMQFSTLCRNDNIIIDHSYMGDFFPSEQCFLELACNHMKISVSNYTKGEKMIKFSGICKASILNYEYLMLQSFVDPFTMETILYYNEESECKLATTIKTFHMRISPHFVHTLSVAENLWRGWKQNALLPWKITTPYVVCNNTDQLLTFSQENTSKEIHLSPFWCHLFAWSNPELAKLLRITVFSGNKKYFSQPFSINRVGVQAVICTAEDKETCLLNVIIVKHSSVVHQIIIRASLLIYNLTQSKMDMCVISYGKENSKSKLTSAQVICGTSLMKNQLLSVVIPLETRLSFKIRFSSSPNEAEPAQWSGLISLKVPQKSNQMSWMVKIPLKNLKEHFQSLWCHITWQDFQGLPTYLVVFRPLCSVVSYLPWKSYVKIYNELDCAIDTCVIAGRGTSTDLFVPDTVSLDKYVLEYKSSENCETIVSKLKIKPSAKHKNNVSSEQTRHDDDIQTTLDSMAESIKQGHWPYLNSETSNFNWKVDQVYDEMDPIIKVRREEAIGCGTTIELYPWAIFINTLNHPIVLSNTNSVHTIDSREIIAPPSIEGTFTLGLVENGKYHLSGTLQLSDDQSFPIPKVSGRIPMNGFVTTSIDCEDYTTFVNITSKNYKEMRVISVHSSYVMCNNSGLDVYCSAWVVCRSNGNNRASMAFDIPTSLESKSIYLPCKGSDFVGQPIMKWYKIGTGDVQALPYLLLMIRGNVACPVRICDLSENQRYPVVFSCHTNTDENCSQPLPSIFITAQQNEGQIFLTLWKETIPQITIHNRSQLPLNVVSSKSVNGIESIFCSMDWNWKFKIGAKCSAHFHTQNAVAENNKKQFSPYYLMFCVENEKHAKETKWSCGVALAPCVNQLVTLPLSQHHIKLAIFRDGFTFVVWIESATTDELSAKMIRVRLSQSFLPLSKNVVLPLPATTATANVDAHIEDSLRVPDLLKLLYNKNFTKPISTSIAVEEISITLAFNDDTGFEENDVATFYAKNVYSHLSSIQKPNEVAQEILCCISVETYQLDNDQYCLRAFDFPVVVLSQPPLSVENTVHNSPFQCHVEDVLLSNNCLPANRSALLANIRFKTNKFLNFYMRDVELIVSPASVYLEDKYITKLRNALEKLFSTTVTWCSSSSSSNIEGNVREWITSNNKMTQVVVRPISCESADAVVQAGTTAVAANIFSPSVRKVESSSSKSVNVSSECAMEDKNSINLSASNCDPPKAVISEQTSPPSGDHLYQADVNDCKADQQHVHTHVQSHRHAETRNLIIIPESVILRSKIVAEPLRLRCVSISCVSLVVSLRTSTAFYIALDRSPLKFSELRRDYLVMTPFEFGNLLVVHYFFGAVYGTGWAISNLEFVGSPGVLARNLGTGVRDFVSMPIYGISGGPRGFVLGIAHGSASLMKHIMAGTLSSVTNFAGSWARTLNRFTLDADDLLQSEQIRRSPPNNITEGILQGLSEFGISILGGISGIAHHPLQYAVSNTSNRSLLNSISLGIVGVLTRPLSGAAELVARTGQGIMSHVGWNIIPTVRNGSSGSTNLSNVQICKLKYEWKREYENIILALEAVNALDITSSLYVILTSNSVHINEISNERKRNVFDLQNHYFVGSDDDPTLIIVQKTALNYQKAEDFSTARIMTFINETNRSFNIKCAHLVENLHYLEKRDSVFSFCVNPQIKNLFLNTTAFVQNMNC